MADLPAFLLLSADFIPAHFDGFPHRLKLLPDGVTLESLGSAPHFAAIFLISTLIAASTRSTVPPLQLTWPSVSRCCCTRHASVTSSPFGAGPQPSMRVDIA